MNPHSLTLNLEIAGNSGDGYIWKYLYTIKPSRSIKFDSTSYIPTPNNWETNTDVEIVRQNASSGQLKDCHNQKPWCWTGNANSTYTGVPILGDGYGVRAYNRYQQRF